MSFASYSATPSANSSIAGTNVAENCAPANINDAIRQLMADGRALNDALPDLSTVVPKTGGVFTGNPTFTGAGGYLYNAASAQPGGAVYVLPTGTALPSSPAEGTFVFFY